MTGSSSNNVASATFEKINQSSGGVPGDVVAGLKSAGEAATVDVVKGVARAPLDALVGILGGNSGDPGESLVET